MFKPWTERQRQYLGNPKAPIVLICDGFAGHTNDELKSATAHDNVRLVFLPAHLTQALDKFVFAILKRSYFEVTADAQVVDRNGRKINRILRAFYSSCTSPMTIRQSWREIGIVGLHDGLGHSIGIEVDGQKVITQHVDVTPRAGYQRTRRNIQQDYLGNRHALELVCQGLCPQCGQPRRQPGPSFSLSLPIPIGPSIPLHEPPRLPHQSPQ